MALHVRRLILPALAVLAVVCSAARPHTHPAVPPDSPADLAGLLEERGLHFQRHTDLPILADALEDAGCADAAILAHCREPGEHVRGCWVVDLLTGRR